MGEISAATAEQTAGIEQINQAIAQMDQVTQQNAALVEEAAAASEAMQEQAGQLAQAVGVFQLDGMQALAVAKIGAAPAPKKLQPKKVAVAPAAPRRLAPAVAPLAKGENWEEF